MTSFNPQTVGYNYVNSTYIMNGVEAREVDPFY